MAPPVDSGTSLCFVPCVPIPRLSFPGQDRSPTTAAEAPYVLPPPPAAPTPKSPLPPPTAPTPAAPAPTAAPSNPAAALTPHLWPHLPPADRAALRLAAPLARQAANGLSTRLRLNDSAFTADLHSLGERFPKATALEISGILAPQIIHNLLVQAPYLWPRLTSLHIQTPSPLDATYVLQILHISCALTHLSLSLPPASYTPALLATLPRGGPTLTSLHLHNLSATPPSTLGPLTALPALTTLALSDISATPFDPLHTLLAHLPHLQSLTLASCTFTPQPPPPPPTTPPPHPRYTPACQPPHLTITSTTGLSGHDILSLAACPTLLTLALSGSLPETLTDLSFLPQTLAHLDLTDNPLPPSAFDTLPPLTHLTTLALASLPPILPPALLPALNPHLRSLSLSPTPATLNLPPLPRLTHLALHGTPRTFSPAPLTALTTLRSLHISHPLNRTLLPPLATLPHLHTLSVSSIQIWPNLGTLPALTALTATAATRFTDADWDDITRAAPALRSLTLHSATRLSDTGLAALPAALPNLTSLTLLGLFRVTVPGCNALGAHPALRDLRLGLPEVDSLYRLLLQQALEARGMHVTCSSE